MSLPPPQQPPVAEALVQPPETLTAQEMALCAEEGIELQPEAEPLNRKARRKARRERAKAKKRRGKLILCEAARKPPENEPLVENTGSVERGGRQVEEPKPEVQPDPSPDDYLIVEHQRANTAQEIPSSEHDANLPKADEYDESVAAAVESLSRKNLVEPAGAETPDALSPSGGRTAHETASQVDLLGSKTRALSDPNERILTKLRRWLQSLASFKRQPPADPAAAPPNLEQLLVIRSELAIIQKRLDNMIGSTRS